MMRWCPSCCYHETFKFTGKEEVKNKKLYYEAECQCCGELIYIFARKVKEA